MILGGAFALIKSTCGDTDNTFTRRIQIDTDPEEFEDNIPQPPVYFVEYTHDLQSRFMEEVSQGNSAEANLLLKEISRRTIRRNDYLLELKIGVAIARTETRIAARNAGVPPQAVDALSSEFAQKVLDATSSSEVLKLSYEMVERFCALVRQYRLQSYSPIIRKTIHFILMNLNQKLTVTEIAKSVNVTPNYLSSIFHNEVGITLTNYIQNMRLEKAAHLLTYTTSHIQDISASIGIYDNNYFAKLFKNKYSKTPTEYRKEAISK